MKPKKVRICGRKFKISFQKPKNMGQNFSNAGRVVCDLQRIWVDSTNAMGRQKEVLLHEIIHAIDFLTAIGLTEAQTHALANGLFTVMVDNPKVEKWILG